MLIPLLRARTRLTHHVMEGMHLRPASTGAHEREITEADLASVGQLLGVTRLSAADPGAGAFPAEGLMYGPLRRVFLPLPVRRDASGPEGEGGDPRWVIIMVSTGTPTTTLRGDTLHALGLGGSEGAPLPEEASMVIDGVAHDIALAQPQDDFVDVLGASSLAILRRCAHHRLCHRGGQPAAATRAPRQWCVFRRRRRAAHAVGCAPCLSEGVRNRLGSGSLRSGLPFLPALVPLPVPA